MGTVAEDRAERFATLYEASYGAIHAYAARRVGAEAADEIAAETFLVAWRRFDTVPSPPLPWLYGVARNVVLRHHTAAGRQELIRSSLAYEQARPQTDVNPVEDPRLWEAWEQLRPAEREVLALVAWEDLTVADGARVLGCSAPVFSVRLHRARRRLERLLTATASVSSPELSKA